MAILAAGIVLGILAAFRCPPRLVWRLLVRPNARGTSLCSGFQSDLEAPWSGDFVG
jgi:hypothetical protein